jgi:hypothetical protein
MDAALADAQKRPPEKWTDQLCSFPQVTGPTSPSSVIPAHFWKAMTAFFVFFPKSPSTGPGLAPTTPDLIRRFCRR